MSRNLNAFLASLTLGALFFAGGAMAQPHAADATVQRVAMACTHGSNAAGCKPAALPATMQAQRSAGAAKPTARREPAARTVAAVDTDGTRFRYDSCGCSTD